MEQMEKLKAIIVKYMPNPEQINEVDLTTNFIRDLNINSADLIDIVLDIEEEFAIIIEDEAMQQMLSVDRALAIINAALQEKKEEQ